MEADERDILDYSEDPTARVDIWVSHVTSPLTSSHVLGFHSEYVTRPSLLPPRDHAPLHPAPIYLPRATYLLSSLKIPSPPLDAS
jgi:hypothetical protein